MNGEMPVSTDLLENLKQLHLQTMRACFEEGAQRAEKEILSYEQYFWSWPSASASPNSGTASPDLNESGLPQEKTLANSDLKRLRSRWEGN